MLRDPIYSRYSSPARVDTSRVVGSTPNFTFLVARLTNPPSFAPGRSSRTPPPATGVSVATLRPLVARPGHARLSGRLRDSWPSPGSKFQSVAEYFSRFRDWFDGRRFNAIPGVWSF